MDRILRLAKEYSKSQHLNLLPHGDKNILQNLNFIYDSDWERSAIYPYEVLTYLFDCYYVLPERPDLASLFCWQAINHSYYTHQLEIGSIGKIKDTKGIELICDAILSEWNQKYKKILIPYLQKLPLKSFRYVASYMLKGYAIERNNIEIKFASSSYSTMKNQMHKLYDILNESYGRAFCQISNPIKKDNRVVFGISDSNKGKSRNIVHSFSLKLKKLMMDEEVEITPFDKRLPIKKYKFNDREKLLFVLFGIIYASRCNNFHGNVASRMNSINADIETFNMYTDVFLIEYIILAIYMNIRNELSDAAMDKLQNNVTLML